MIISGALCGAEPCFLIAGGFLLKLKIKSRRAHNYATIFAITVHYVLRKAETEQLDLAVRASFAVQTCAGNDLCVAYWFFTMFCQKAPSPVFLNGTKFL